MERLVVVRAFGHWRVGDVIADAVAVAAVVASEHSGHVVRINPAQEF